MNVRSLVVGLIVCQPFLSLAGEPDVKLQKEASRLFLVKSHEAVDRRNPDCILGGTKFAAVFFRADKIPSKGEPFHVIDLSGKQIRGILEKVLAPETECSFEASEMNTHLGLLRLEKEISWDEDGEYYARLAVRGAPLEAARVGSIDANSSVLAARYSKLIGGATPKGKGAAGEKYTLITSPAPVRKYLLVTASHADSKEYETLGDKAVRTVTSLWDVSQEKPVLLFRVQEALSILSAIKLGVHGLQFVMSEFDGATTRYNFVALEGNQLSKLKTLYEWMD